MVNQIIQKEVDIFESFVKEHFIQEQDYYIYNIEVFKKLLFESLMAPFLESLKSYYYKNKYYYLERSPMTYNYFNTILRQIFKRNQIHFVKKVKYVMSKYQVEYYIYFNGADWWIHPNNCSFVSVGYYSFLISIGVVGTFSSNLGWWTNTIRNYQI